MSACGEMRTDCDEEFRGKNGAATNCIAAGTRARNDPACTVCYECHSPRAQILLGTSSLHETRSGQARCTHSGRQPNSTLLEDVDIDVIQKSIKYANLPCCRSVFCVRTYCINTREKSEQKRQCSQLWSAPATQRLIFPRFDGVVGFRHTFLCRPWRDSLGECGTPAPRASACVSNKARY